MMTTRRSDKETKGHRDKTAENLSHSFSVSLRPLVPPSLRLSVFKSLRPCLSASGQAVTEMVFVLPLLIMLAGGMLFMVYAGWQDLKLQQAANLLARVEGQEKVGGGPNIGAINQENGFGPGSGYQDADATVGNKNFDTGNETVNSGGSPVLFTRMINLLKGLFPGGGVSLAQPVSGQNVDQITVTKVMPMFKIPFLSKGNAGLPQQIVLQGQAYGGEDPYMYALPRWGTTSDPGNGGTSPEWRKLLHEAGQNVK
jgi:hypothetical protein